MKFWSAFVIFWIVFLLFFAIGLPLIIHYAGNHHLSDFEMINTSASKAFALLGLGTVLWLVVFIYYIKEFLINPFFKKNGIIRLLDRDEKRKKMASQDFEFMDSKSYQRPFEMGNTTEILQDKVLKPPYIETNGQEEKWNAIILVLTVIGLLLLITLAAGILVYSYINESHGYGWRYLYFWHPYIMIPGSFILYLSFLFDITNGVFSKFLGKSMKP